MKLDGVLEQVTTTLRGLSMLAWVLIGLAVIAVLVLAIVGFVWWRRRRAKPDRAAPAQKKEALGKLLPAEARAFRRGLPARVRRSFDSFQPVVVFGTESSGKAAIVERFSGVAQRRVELGAVVERGGGHLRCTLGGDVVVFEPSEEVLRAPPEHVNGGLARALVPALRRRAPLVVVCVSPDVLDKQSEPQLAELGGLLRAKLDVLAALRDGPCTVRVVLSDVPGYARFDALFKLLELPGVPAILSLDRVDEAALREVLLGYTDELGAALVRLTPRETLELVGFFEALPQLASALGVLLGELFAPEGDRTPRLDGLYLVPEQGGPNPLVVPPGLARPGTSALLKHRLIALSLAAAGCALLLGGYRSDAAKWSHVVAVAAAYDLKGNHEVDLRDDLRGYAEVRPDGLVDRLMPGFYVAGPPVVACAYAEKVRRTALAPLLDEVLSRPAERSQPERALYLAALLYASHGSKLGQLIGERIDDWATVVQLTPSQVTDYLAMALPYRDERWLDRMLDSSETKTAMGVAGQLARLLALLAPEHVWTAPEIAEVRALVVELRPAVRALVPFSAAQSVLALPPLDRLARSFKVHAGWFTVLAQLHDNHVALDELFDVVADAVHGSGTAAHATPARPRTFAELATTLAPLAVEQVTDRKRTVSFIGTDYNVDPSALLRALRGDQVGRIVEDFIDAADDKAESRFVATHQDRQIPLPIAWPAGTSGATSHARLYTREVFESEVKAAALAIHQLLDKLPVRPELRDRLARTLREALQSYALAYEAELERLISAFSVEVSSEVAALRVLRVLAGTSSPLRTLVAVVAHDAQLGLATDKSGVFDAMQDVESHFGALADLLAAAKGGDALVEYQDILRMLASRLAGARADKAAAGGGAAPRGGPAPAAAVEAKLSPAGALAFAEAQGAADTPSAALDAWLADKPLTDDVAGLFRGPVRVVYAIGARNVGAALASWGRDIEAAAAADMFSRFPFDRRSGDDVDPQTLTDWLQPKRGRFVGEVMPAVAGLIIPTRGWNGRVRHQSARPCGEDICIRVPASLLATLDRLAAASSLLWDDTGKPRPLEVEVTPRPFTLAAGNGPVPELVRLSVGESTVFYFNQRPKRSVLALDWTKDSIASLGVQLKQDDALTLTPPAVVAAGTPWSFFHLLQQAERRGATYTWRIPLGHAQVLAVSCDVLDHATPQLGGHDATAARGPR